MNTKNRIALISLSVLIIFFTGCRATFTLKDIQEEMNEEETEDAFADETEKPYSERDDQAKDMKRELDVEEGESYIKRFRERFADTWNDSRYEIANTAKNTDYLKENEKEVFYFLNLARKFHRKFANTYVKHYKGRWGRGEVEEFKRSRVGLLEDLKEMADKDVYLQLLKPDKELWKFAKCHAIEMNKEGYGGHDREVTGCTDGPFAECISYAWTDGLQVVLQLLIDEGLTTASHRKICLTYFNDLGVSIKPHKVKGHAAVLDFY